MTLGNQTAKDYLNSTNWQEPSVGASPTGLPASLAREFRDRLDELSSLFSQGVRGPSRPAASSAADPPFHGFSPRPSLASRHLSPPRNGFALDSNEDRRAVSHDVVGGHSPVLAGSPSPPVVRLAILVFETFRCTPLRVLTLS